MSPYSAHREPALRSPWACPPLTVGLPSAHRGPALRSPWACPPLTVGLPSAHRGPALRSPWACPPLTVGLPSAHRGPALRSPWACPPLLLSLPKDHPDPRRSIIRTPPTDSVSCHSLARMIISPGPCRPIGLPHRTNLNPNRTATAALTRTHLRSSCHCKHSFPRHCKHSLPRHCERPLPRHCERPLPRHCERPLPRHCERPFPCHCERSAAISLAEKTSFRQPNCRVASLAAMTNCVRVGIPARLTPPPRCPIIPASLPTGRFLSLRAQRANLVAAWSLSRPNRREVQPCVDRKP